MRFILLLLACGLTSCTSNYHVDYRKAVQNFKQGDRPTGPWKGAWKSEVNGHKGPLWCLVTQDPKEPDTWTFRYRAGWGVLQFGDYKHPVKTTLQADHSLPVDDKMELPNNYGTYAVRGKLTPKEFKFRFEGDGDKGTMTLARPK